MRPPHKQLAHFLQIEFNVWFINFKEIFCKSLLVKTFNSIMSFLVARCSSAGIKQLGKLCTLEHWASLPLVRNLSICGSPDEKLNIIPLCISIALLRSKHSSAELLLRVGLTHAV